MGKRLTYLKDADINWYLENCNGFLSKYRFTGKFWRPCYKNEEPSALRVCIKGSGRPLTCWFNVQVNEFGMHNPIYGKDLESLPL